MHVNNYERSGCLMDNTKKGRAKKPAAPKKVPTHLVLETPCVIINEEYGESELWCVQCSEELEQGAIVLNPKKEWLGEGDHYCVECFADVFKGQVKSSELDGYQYLPGWAKTNLTKALP